MNVRNLVIWGVIVVVLIGLYSMMTGGGRGAAAVLIYLALAAMGLPVLAEGGSGLERFTGPTAGYLFAFPLAALVAGQPGRRRLFRSPGAETALMIGAHLLILAVGAGWLATSLGLRDALAHGFTPFLIGAAVKSVAVAVCAGALRRLALFRP